MHEYGMCDGVVEAVLNRAAGRWVRQVRIRIGAQHRVVEDIFRDAFKHCAAGTVAEHAVVEIVSVPMQGECHNCTRAFLTMDALAACPHCNDGDVRLSGGDELTLESLEYDLENKQKPQLETGHVH